MSSDKHYGDAWYEVWRSGGNPDSLDRDASDEDYYGGYSPEETARSHMRHNRVALDIDFDDYEEYP